MKGCSENADGRQQTARMFFLAKTANLEEMPQRLKLIPEQNIFGAHVTGKGLEDPDTVQ